MPATVDELHDWLDQKDPNWIDADGKIVWRNGTATVSFGIHAGRSLRDLATKDRGFLEWILRKDFSDKVKEIVREALAGQFPGRGDTKQ